MAANQGNRQDRTGLSGEHGSAKSGSQKQGGESSRKSSMKEDEKSGGSAGKSNVNK